MTDIAAATKFPRSLYEARARMVATVESQKARAFTSPDLMALIGKHREQWDLKAYLPTTRIVDFLLAETPLKQVRLESQHYAGLERFCWGDQVSPYEIALTLRRGSYLSHGTAVSLLGLTDEAPTYIYVNKEQSPKPSNSQLSQEGINRAFAATQRKSKNIFRLRTWRFVLLSGKWTSNLGVEQRRGPQGEELLLTGLERTLIDIAVRPHYAGGVFKVAEAYASSVGTVRIPVLAEMLKELDYTYPYHQAIGFYLERAGAPREELEPLRRFGISFDFFLAHGLVSPVLDSSWRIRIPEGL